MSALLKRAAILFCALILALPPLYAQNDANLPKVTPPLKESPPGNAQNNNTFFMPPVSYEAKNKENLLTQPGKKKGPLLRDILNKKETKKDPKEKYDGKAIRKEWQEYFGLDLWYPYFKAKEAEKWAADKTEVRIFKLKGRLELEGNQIKQIFRVKF